MADRNQIFMKLTGDKVGPVAGDCEVASRKNWIELDDWNWSLGRNSDNDAIEPSAFSFTKLMDGASTTMLEAMKKDDKLYAIIVVEESSEQDFALFMELGEVRIANYEMSAASDKEDSIEETWVFDYAQIQFEHRPKLGENGAPATVRRRPGLSNEAPTNKKSELIALAKGFDRKTLDEIWKEILTAMEDAKTGQSGQSDKTSGGGRAAATAAPGKGGVKRTGD